MVSQPEPGIVLAPPGFTFSLPCILPHALGHPQTPFPLCLHTGRPGGRQQGWESKAGRFALVSSDCRNKAPQTGRLNTTETQSRPVLEPRSLNSRCWQCWLPLRFQGRIFSMPLFRFWCFCQSLAIWGRGVCRCTPTSYTLSHSHFPSVCLH